MPITATRQPRLLIVDPARRFRSKKDRVFADHLARAFFRAQFEVVWAIDVDDPLPDRPYALVHRILEPSGVDASATVARVEDDLPLPLEEVPGDSQGGHLNGTKSLSAVGLGTAAVDPGEMQEDPSLLTAAHAQRNLNTLIAELGPSDVMVIPAANLMQLESLYHLYPTLQLSSPIPSTLHVRLTLAEPGGAASASGAELVGKRLKSSLPIRTLVLHTETPDHDALQRSLDLPVHYDDTDLDPERLRRRFGVAPLAESPSPHRVLDVVPSLVVERFGPLVVLVSALWGRTGSTLIFDAQARYLIERGFVVARLFVDHYPHSGVFGAMRMRRLLWENFEKVRPHLHFVAERNEGSSFLRQLRSNPEFQRASPVKRVSMMFQGARMNNAAGAAWCAQKAVLAIVNHLPHVALTRDLTKAPIVLETHDLYSNLLTSHGIPGFVPKGPDGQTHREIEEAEVWRGVAACVNLSSDDHEAISRVAKKAFLVRPYINGTKIQRRSWLEVMAANKLPESYKAINQFDMMLWGDWHGGNVAGVRWFLEEVIDLHPRLRDASVALVGRVRDGLPGGLLKRSNLHVLGFVDRLDDFMARSTVLVVPDRPGSSGISVKMLEACVQGYCFSTTPAGLRGVSVGDTGLIPPNNAAGFARDIAELLESRQARRRRQAVARRLYELNFSSAAYSRAWDSVTRSVLLDVSPPAASTSEITVNAAGAASEAWRGKGDQQRLPESPRLPVPKETSDPKSYRGRADRPRLSAIVCTYDRHDVLPDAIASLLQQNTDDDFLEIIVVDNSPDQAAAARFGERYAQEPSVTYLLEPTPGLSHARNVGTAAARADIVAFIDDDAIAASDWASRMVEAFETLAGSAGVVGGRVLPRWVGPRPPWLADNLLSHLSIIDWGTELRPITPKEWLAGCNIAFDKRLLLSVGGFSRALGRVGPGLALLSNEETEVADKIAKVGGRSIYCPDALVHHVIDPARLTRTWFRRRVAWQAVSDYIQDARRLTEYSSIAAERVQDEILNNGFFSATNDPEKFKWEVGLVYDLVASVLAGGKERQADTSPIYTETDSYLADPPQIVATLDSGTEYSVDKVVVEEKRSISKLTSSKLMSAIYWQHRLARLQRSIRKRLR